MKKLLLVAAGAVFLTACPPPLPEPEPPVRWQATAEPVEPRPVAAANLVAVSGLGQTQAAIAVSGGQPGQTHGWHIRQGACGSQGTMVGMPEQYGALRPDSRGIANATATLEQELMTGETYHVNVTVSPQDRGNIMACGNLRQQ